LIPGLACNLFLKQPSGGGQASTSWKREMIACGMMDFESIMRAIGSNTGRWGYSDCRLTLRRQDKSVPRARPEKSIEEVGEKKTAVMNRPKDSWE
jgi:hypothetical protein